MIPLEKWKIFDTLQKLPKTVGNLGKNDAIGLESCPKWNKSPNLVTLAAIEVNSIPILKLKVDFPAVTICSPGLTNSNLESGFYKLLFNFLKDNNAIIPYLTPYNASLLLHKVTSL